MKTNKKANTILLLMFSAITFSFFSCNKYQEIADADYPDQIIYMPTATGGIYYVTQTEPTSSVPTEGSPTDFYVDEVNNKLVIPLGVYRGGLSRKGSFTVSIEANTDTLTSLMNGGELTGIDMLPESEYALPSSVNIGDGKEFANFNFEIGLNFLLANSDKKFVIAVEINSSEIKVNPLLSTTVLVFDANLLDQP